MNDAYKLLVMRTEERQKKKSKNQMYRAICAEHIHNYILFLGVEYYVIYTKTQNCKRYTRYCNTLHKRKHRTNT